jgi:hypothetical protein
MGEKKMYYYTLETACSGRRERGEIPVETRKDYDRATNHPGAWPVWFRVEGDLHREVDGAEVLSHLGGK